MKKDKYIVFNKNVMEGLTELQDNSVQTCVTSPPYYNLRDYGVDGQIGLEKTPEEYINNLVKVFRHVRRVLKDDGTLWVVIGDSYNGSGKANGDKGINKALNDTNNASHLTSPTKVASLKDRDLIGIPWMLAFALRSDGWYLRQDIIWSKPNPMPESVKSRCTKSHEYVFLLSKSPKYYFDYEALEEVATGYDDRKDIVMKGSKKYEENIMPFNQLQSLAKGGRIRWKFKNLDLLYRRNNSIHPSRIFEEKKVYPVRRKRSVWSIPTQPFKGRHFAVFPEKLAEYCILAGSKEGDAVLDVFSGAATTGKVAMQYNRIYRGYEINADYIKIGNERIEKQLHTKQLSLW